MTTKITIKKIAELTGVNCSTVSRVLNPKPGYIISQEMQEKILSVAREYHYVQSDAAKNLRRRKTSSLGIILKRLNVDLASPFFSLFLHGFCCEAVRCKYRPVLLPVISGDTDAEIQDYIYANNADGYLIGTSISDHHTIQILKERMCPAIVYYADRQESLLDTHLRNFRIDVKAATAELFGALIRRNLTKCVIIDVPELKKYQRYHLLKQAEQYALEPVARLVYDCPLGELNSRHCAGIFAEQHFRELRMAPMIIAPNDLIALGICDCLAKRGLRVGKDFFISGYDNIEDYELFGPETTPILTTIDFDMANGGRIAAQKLIQSIETGGAELADITHQAKFIERMSTNP